MGYFKRKRMTRNGMSCECCVNYRESGRYPKCMLASDYYTNFETGKLTLYSRFAADEVFGTHRCRFKSK